MNAARRRSALTATKDGFRRLLRLIARPVRRSGRRGGAVIQPYRGYGHDHEIFLMGRVLQQTGLGARIAHGTLLGDVIDVARRFFRRGVADVAVEARFADAEKRVKTDAEGYFRIRMRVPNDPASADGWHAVDLALADSGDDVRAQARVFIPPKTCRFVVISDIDDTVMVTGVANKLKMLWRLFATKAESRLAFPGVGAFYRALHSGVGGSERNPMLYVSRGPWSIYEVLDEFFNLHRIPVGPILFLREWGVTLQHPLPKRAKDHKRMLIKQMLSLYHDLPFILIGDSGQRDPEIYSEVVHANPSRVLAVYIRNVTRDAERLSAIRSLAEQVAEAGSSLVLAAESHAMAIHAAEHGLISAEAVQAVAEEQLKAGETLDSTRPRQAQGRVRTATLDDVKTGRLENALKETPDHQPPESIVVERDDASAEGVNFRHPSRTAAQRRR